MDREEAGFGADEEAIAGKDVLVGEGIAAGERFLAMDVVGDEIGEHDGV